MSSRGNKTLFVISVVFLVIALIGAVFVGIFGIEFLSLQASTENDLGEGIASVLMVVFTFIGVCVSVIACLFGAVFSVLCFRSGERKRSHSLIFFLTYAAVILFCAVITVLCII